MYIVAPREDSSHLTCTIKACRRGPYCRDASLLRSGGKSKTRSMVTVRFVVKAFTFRPVSGLRRCCCRFEPEVDLNNTIFHGLLGALQGT